MNFNINLNIDIADNADGITGLQEKLASVKRLIRELNGEVPKAENSDIEKQNEKARRYGTEVTFLGSAKHIAKVGDQVEWRWGDLSGWYPTKAQHHEYGLAFNRFSQVDEYYAKNYNLPVDWIELKLSDGGPIKIGTFYAA